MEPTFDPTLDPTYTPTSMPTIEPTVKLEITKNTNIEPTLEPTIDPTVIMIEMNDNGEDFSLDYLISWWLDGNNWGWKAFIIIGILCAIIGCICIACMCGYFRGKDKKRSKNQFGFVPSDIELEKKVYSISFVYNINL